MSDNKNHMLKKDADLVRGGKTEKDIHLHNELHPADRKNGKGVKESKSRIKKIIDEISNPFCLTMIAAAVVCLVIVLLFVLDKSHKSKLSKRKKRRKEDRDE